MGGWWDFVRIVVCVVALLFPSFAEARRGNHGGAGSEFSLALDDGAPVDGSPSFRADYSYDGLGRVTRASLDERRPTAEVQQFAYDEASRLLSKSSSLPASAAHVGAYRYGEGAGPHAVTTAGVESLAYDAGGLMSERRSAGSSTWVYAWDGRGRLSAVSRDAAVVQASSYDAAGMRVVKREGASTTLYLAPDFEVRDGLATTYVKAGSSAIARVEEPAFATTFFPDVAPLGAGTSAAPAPDGVITAADAWLVHASKSGLVDLPPPDAAKAKTADVDKMLASAARRILGADATQTTYVASDHLGSPSLETNERGEVVARRWHGPYGEERGATGVWNETRGFTGKERDDATGLADHGARYLDTRLGRWTAPDPLAVRELGAADADVYGYVGGRVTGSHDPDGLAPHIVFGAAVGGFVAGAVEGYQQYQAGHFDGRALTVAVVGGSASGAMAAMTGGASLATQATVGAVTNAYIGTVSRVATRRDVTPETVAADAASGAAGPLIGRAFSRGAKAIGGGKAASGEIAAGGVTNPIPARMARVVPAEFAGGARLGAPSATEAWVTAADDLAGIMTSEGLSSRLTLVDRSGSLIPGPRAVIEFDAVTEGLASPVLRDAPGFVGRGMTAGGAREFVLPNLCLEQLQNVTTRVLP
jgi:RHS repeat-associated protein